VTRERRFALEAQAARFTSGLVQRLPRSWALALGRGLGRLWADLDPRHVRIAVENLRHAFPHWDEPRLFRTARAVYAHFGQVLFDILWLEPRSREEIMGLVDVDGVEAARAAFAEGRGVVMVASHFGNWELNGIALGWLFEPVAVVARTLDNPVLDERLVAFRRKSGNQVVYKRQALGQALRLLRAGKGVAFLVDQNVQHDEGIFVDFFGRPAATTTAAAALAVRCGSPILYGWTKLRADGRYQMHYDVMRPTPGAERVAEVARVTQALTHEIEDYVRVAPEQWLWIHRRWKTRPPGEGEGGAADPSRLVAAEDGGSARSPQPGDSAGASAPAEPDLGGTSEPR
jgi:KDO2-lipid IV(A) lauroyltransferase